MVSLSTGPLLFLPLVSFYFSHAVALGAVLGGDCANNSACSTSITHLECCAATATDLRQDSKTCVESIVPNKNCGAKGNSSCVHNGVCVCGGKFMASKTSCYSAVTMAVAEISTIFLCFMLAYFEILK